MCVEPHLWALPGALMRLHQVPFDEPVLLGKLRQSLPILANDTGQAFTAPGVNCAESTLGASQLCCVLIPA